MISKMKKPNNHELAQIYAILRYQFGVEAADHVLARKNEIYLTRYTTGKIRTVYLNKTPIAHMNPRTGYFTLSNKGAKILHAVTPKDTKRITVNKELFTKFSSSSLLAPAVIKATNDIRAGDEVFIVDEKDELLAIAKAILCAQEINTVKYGEVARIRRKT